MIYDIKNHLGGIRDAGGIICRPLERMEDELFLPKLGLLELKIRVRGQVVKLLLQTAVLNSWTRGA